MGRKTDWRGRQRPTVEARGVQLVAETGLGGWWLGLVRRGHSGVAVWATLGIHDGARFRMVERSIGVLCTKMAD